MDRFAMYFKGKRKGLKKPQIAALGYYRFCNLQMDRYCESVFYIPNGSWEKQLQADIDKAVAMCKKLGVGEYC